MLMVVLLDKQLATILQTKAECIYHDQIDDQMLRRPDGRPDGSWATRWHLGDQINPGDQNGDQILIGVVPFEQISGAS